MKTQSKFSAMCQAAQLQHVHRLVVLVSNFISKSAGDTLLALVQGGRAVCQVCGSMIVVVMGSKKVSIKMKGGA